MELHLQDNWRNILRAGVLVLTLLGLVLVVAYGAAEDAVAVALPF